jgi:hypothetical protein
MNSYSFPVSPLTPARRPVVSCALPIVASHASLKYLYVLCPEFGFNYCGYYVYILLCRYIFWYLTERLRTSVNMSGPPKLSEEK